MSDFRGILYDNYISLFKGRGRQRSDEFGSYYFTWFEYKYLPLLNGLSSESSILEIGCGSGYMLAFLRENGFKNITGIDISNEQFELSSNKGFDVEVADVFEYLNRKNHTFDVIIALDFVEHFRRDELMLLLPLIFNSLIKGGRLILQTPNGAGLFPNQVIYGDLTHMTIFTPNSIQQILKLFGFDDISFYETGPVPKNIIGRIRMVLWRLIKVIANAIRRIEANKSQKIWTECMICYCKKPIS